MKDPDRLVLVIWFLCTFISSALQGSLESSDASDRLTNGPSDAAPYQVSLERLLPDVFDTLTNKALKDSIGTLRETSKHMKHLVDNHREWYLAFGRECLLNMALSSRDPIENVRLLVADLVQGHFHFETFRPCFPALLSLLRSNEHGFRDHMMRHIVFVTTGDDKYADLSMVVEIFEFLRNARIERLNVDANFFPQDLFKDSSEKLRISLLLSFRRIAASDLALECDLGLNHHELILSSWLRSCRDRCTKVLIHLNGPNVVSENTLTRMMHRLGQMRKLEHLTIEASGLAGPLLSLFMSDKKHKDGSFPRLHSLSISDAGFTSQVGHVDWMDVDALLTIPSLVLGFNDNLIPFFQALAAHQGMPEFVEVLHLPFNPLPFGLVWKASASRTIHLMESDGGFSYNEITLRNQISLTISMDEMSSEDEKLVVQLIRRHVRDHPQEFTSLRYLSLGPLDLSELDRWLSVIFHSRLRLDSLAIGHVSLVDIMEIQSIGAIFIQGINNLAKANVTSVTIHRFMFLKHFLDALIRTLRDKASLIRSLEVLGWSFEDGTDFNEILATLPGTQLHSLTLSGPAGSLYLLRTPDSTFEFQSVQLVGFVANSLEWLKHIVKRRLRIGGTGTQLFVSLWQCDDLVWVALKDIARMLALLQTESIKISIHCMRDPLQCDCRRHLHGIDVNHFLVNFLEALVSSGSPVRQLSFANVNVDDTQDLSQIKALFSKTSLTSFEYRNSHTHSHLRLGGESGLREII